MGPSSRGYERTPRGIGELLGQTLVSILKPHESRGSIREASRRLYVHPVCTVPKAFSPPLHRGRFAIRVSKGGGRRTQT